MEELNLNLEIQRLVLPGIQIKHLLSLKKKIDEIYNEENFTELNANFIKNLNQTKITNAKFKWLDYDIILDYTMATKIESKLVELKLEFESNESIQIATVIYKIKENSSPENYSYNISGELLLALNNEIEINNSGSSKFTKLVASYRN